MRFGGLGFSVGHGRGMRFAAVGGTPTAPGEVPEADYIVSNDSEWNAVFANSDETLSGKIVEIQGDNFTRRTLDNRTFDPPLTIRSADASAKLPAMLWDNTLVGLHLAVNFQMPGWPKTYRGMIYFSSGFDGDDIVLDGCSFRHGYGAEHTTIDITADLDEYNRVDNVQTATTSSMTYALSWQDVAATSGLIEFFNRGAVDVYATVGNSGVTTSTGGGTLIAAGTRVRFSGLNPTTDTHIAIITDSGTSEINARTEIGLTYYLANAFATEGGTTVGDITIKNCTFDDLAGGVKSLPPATGVAVIMDNVFHHIYADNVLYAPAPGGKAYFLRNQYEVPFARSGIAENLNGDAGDPHGDIEQMTGTAGTIGPVYYAGGRTFRPAMRSGIRSQGAFISDNDFVPSYNQIFSISNVYPGGATHGFAMGEASYPAGDALLYGLTAIDSLDLATGASHISITTDGSYDIYVGACIAHRFTGDEDYLLEDSVALDDVASAAAVFPNIADFAAATSVSELETALTSAAEGAAAGAVATRDAIDWSTTDYTAVILWQNVPSGVAWADQDMLALDTLIELDLRKVLNRRDNQTVVPGAGVEWRSVDIDGTTEVQAWTTSSGTIDPDQFTQIRGRTSAELATPVALPITINGFEETVTLTTTNVSDATIPQYINTYPDEANIPTGNTRTFNGGTPISIGTPHEDRVLIIAVWDAAQLTEAPTVGGVAVTDVLARPGPNSWGIYYLPTHGTALEDATSAVFASVNNSGATSGRAILGVAVAYPSTHTPLDSAMDAKGGTTDSVAADVQVANGGCMLWAATSLTGANTYTWSGSDTLPAPEYDEDFEATGTQKAIGFMLTTEDSGTGDFTLSEQTSGSKRISVVTFGAEA